MALTILNKPTEIEDNNFVWHGFKFPDKKQIHAINSLTLKNVKKSHLLTPYIVYSMQLYKLCKIKKSLKSNKAGTQSLMTHYLHENLWIPESSIYLINTYPYLTC